MVFTGVHLYQPVVNALDTLVAPLVLIHIDCRNSQLNVGENDLISKKQFSEVRAQNEIIVMYCTIFLRI